MKQCPFCSYADVVCDSFKDTEWFVRCNNCGALGPSEKAEEDAIKKWNRADRPPAMCCTGKGEQCKRCPMRGYDQKAEKEHGGMK